MTIQSFKCKHTAAIFMAKNARRFGVDVQKVAQRKLLLLNEAQVLEDLRSPPSNHLEALQGDREGEYSIRINKQWRLCFTWQGGHAYNVEIVDYH
jgi:proteic killer suppression protein